MLKKTKEPREASRVEMYVGNETGGSGEGGGGRARESGDVGKSDGERKFMKGMQRR